MLRLYHSPMACSLASRLALAESGLAHEVVVINTRMGEQNADTYRRINPRGKVPALDTGQGVITESSAILPLIADLAPDAGLLPPAGTIERARAQSWLALISTALHPALSGAGFPERFEGCDPAAVKARFLTLASGVFQGIDSHLTQQPYLLDAFSLCDLYLFVFSLWRRSPALAGGLPDLANVDALTQRILTRPKVAAIVSDEMKLFAGS